ncbi:type II secretion system F family protein [Caulobacter henricii]|uniref:Type II secretion system protein GspF domain-containing protein n=1 Tax=Caulobacter henricii TaxID=69395 RepID=A0A0P0NZ15_9CAUL|nr:type II secretion system F family protein [Caulobacter henricii]ALL13086.1 hypothetical protein AQ619_06825 [Caulobacter henricii]
MTSWTTRPGDDEASELAAVAVLAAAEAGAPPAAALELGLKLAARNHPATADLQTLWRRMRFSPDPGKVLADPGIGKSGQELVALVADTERNGDDIRERVGIFLKNSFERRDFDLRQRIEVVPVYMIIVLVLFFMPAILVVLVGPSFLALLRVLYDV